jgi:hypothetical protein
VRIEISDITRSGRSRPSEGCCATLATWERPYWYRRESVPSARPTGRPTRQVARPREQWIEVAVPAIVSADTFEAAQRVACRNIAFSARRAPGDRWLLRGLVLCGQCRIKCACSRKANSRGRLQPLLLLRLPERAHSGRAGAALPGAQHPCR